MSVLDSRCSYAKAISIALRSSRCMFSTSAISMTFSSLIVRMYAGMAVSPASCDALQRRSPAIIWNLSSSTWRNVMGCIMPISRMLLASSCKAVSSNSLRGWLGLASIWLNGISFIVELPWGRTSSVEMSASSPRPNALPYLFFTAILFVWFYGCHGFAVIRYAVASLAFRLSITYTYNLAVQP